MIDESMRNKFLYYLKLFRYREISDHKNIIWINPNDVTYFVYPGFYKESRRPRNQGGDWDKRKYECDVRKKRDKKGNVEQRSLFRLKDYYLYKSMEKRYENNIPWSETEFYDVALENIERNGEFWHGCKNKQDLQNRFKYIDTLYKDMENNGYKSQKELGGLPSNEININITREGEFVLDDGRHRLIVAQLLELDEILAKVTVKHNKWI